MMIIIYVLGAFFVGWFACWKAYKLSSRLAIKVTSAVAMKLMHAILTMNDLKLLGGDKIVYYAYQSNTKANAAKFIESVKKIGITYTEK